MIRDCSLSMGYQGFLVDPFASARKYVGPFQNEMAAAGDADESFRLIRKFEKPLGRAYRNDVVFLSMDHKNRNMHSTDREVRAELIEHQPAHWEERVVR